MHNNNYLTLHRHVDLLVFHFSFCPLTDWQASLNRHKCTLILGLDKQSA